MAALSETRDAGPARQGTLLVVLSAVAFSTAGWFTRLIDLDVWTVLFWRGLFGGLFIALWVVARDRAAAIGTLRSIGGVGIVAAICSALATICFLNALRLTTVADVMVIGATAPFVSAGLAWVWTGARERPATLVASGMALLGIVVMAGEAIAGGRLLGNLLALAMTLLISTMMVAIRRQRAVCMLPAAALSAFLCALLVGPWAAPGSVAAGDLPGLFLFGTMQFGLGLVLLTLGTRRISAARAALLGALDTPLAPTLVWLGIGEVPSAATLVGGAIVLAAVVADIVVPTADP